MYANQTTKAQQKELFASLLLALFMQLLLLVLPCSALEKADTDQNYTRATNRATELFHKGNHREALATVAKALKLYPSGRKARIVKALCLRGEGDYDKSDEILVQLIKEDPLFPEPHLYRATGFTDKGRLNEALEEIEIYGRFKGFDAVFHPTACLLINLNRVEEARVICQKYLKSHPKDERAKMLLALCYAQAGGFANALQVLDTMQPSKAGEFHAWRAYCLAQLGRDKEVSAELKLAIRDGASTTLALLSGHLIRLRYQKKESMVHLYESIIPGAEKSDRQNSGQSVSTSGDVASAIKAMQSKVKSKSAAPEDWSCLGALLWRNRQAKDAIEAYTTFLQLRQSDAQGYLSRGIIYQELLMDDEAIQDCNKALALAPGLKEVYKVRAKSYKRQGRIGDARADLFRYTSQ